MVAKDLWKVAVAHHRMICQTHEGVSIVLKDLAEKSLEDARQGIIVIDPSLRAELADFYPEPEKGDK